MGSIALFADVADVIEAVVRLAEHPKAVGQVFNVGSTEEISINGLAERVRINHSRSEIIFIPYDQLIARI
jgi:UDP-glucose 4-epimerase